MPTIDDLSNTKSDIDFFDNLLKRAEKAVEKAVNSEQFDFVEAQRKKYNRQGDGMFITDRDLEQLQTIAAGAAKLKPRKVVAPKKTVRKTAKKTKKAKAKKRAKAA